MLKEFSDYIDRMICEQSEKFDESNKRFDEIIKKIELTNNIYVLKEDDNLVKKNDNPN